MSFATQFIITLLLAVLTGATIGIAISLAVWARYMISEFASIKIEIRKLGKDSGDSDIGS